MAGGIIEILLAEDSPTDRVIALQALETFRLPHRVSAVANGEEVIAFLRKEGKYQEAPTPDLILLDVNMPRKSGLETLAEIKGDEHWRVIPVFIFTASRVETDILKAYEHHANCYIVKPVDFDRFQDVIRTLESFWFHVVKLPPKKEYEPHQNSID
jgi:two-component system, chemotaxis family, response regulator Rcp1